MRIICYSVHHRTDEVPETVGPKTLSDVAVLCDKYDCAGPLKAWVTLNIMEKRPFDWSDTEAQMRLSNMHLLLAAYVFDLPEVFSELSRCIILTQCGPFLDLPGNLDDSLLPPTLRGRYSSFMSRY